MKNIFKKIAVILIIIICLGVFTFTIDNSRVKRNKKPIFVVMSPFLLKDGGTHIYYGLGYKVIDYNVLDGKQGMEIGTWWLEYSSKINN